MTPIAKTNSAQRCPDCDAAIAAADINIAEGVALCPGCGTLLRLSELALNSRPVGEILAKSPAGCTVESLGRGLRVRASLRSVGGFIGTLCFALFWNGITGMFVFIALAGLYANLVGPLPDWFPAAQVDGKPKMNDGPMGLGATLFLCLFLVPFVAIGFVMACAAVLQIIGRVEVMIDEYGSYVSTGFGWLRWKQRFDARDVTAVSQAWSTWKQNEERMKQIELSADRPISFGSQLRQDRIEWLRAVLHEIFCGKNAGGYPELPPLHWLPQRK